MDTYYTVLPFTPWLYHLYEPEMSHSLTVLQGLDPIWTSCLANLVVEDNTSIVLVSLDGTRLAVGGHNYISLWDTQTTALRRYLHKELHKGPRGLHNKHSTKISSSESTVPTIWRGCLSISDTTTVTK